MHHGHSYRRSSRILIISRALVELYSHPLLRDNLAFRGGTALFKLHLPPARYSEDIDLVQNLGRSHRTGYGCGTGKVECLAGGSETETVGRAGDADLARRVRGRLPLRLKVEIDSREHFTVRGYQKFRFEMVSRWHTSTASISHLQLRRTSWHEAPRPLAAEEGQDLFDLWLAASVLKVNPEAVV
jgi:hypothetical protein